MLKELLEQSDEVLSLFRTEQVALEPIKLPQEPLEIHPKEPPPESAKIFHEEKRVLEVKWHREGKTAISSIYQWLESDLTHMSKLDSHRYPILLSNQQMLLSTEDGIVVANYKGERLWFRQIPGLISAVPLL